MRHYYTDNQPPASIKASGLIDVLQVAQSGVVVDARFEIGTAKLSGGGATMDGLRATAGDVKVSNLEAMGYDGDGVVVDANGCVIKADESRDNTGYGLRLGDTGTVVGCDVTLTNLQVNDAGAFYYEDGRANTIHLSSFIPSGYTGYDTAGALPDIDDEFTIDFRGSGDGTGRASQRMRVNLTSDGTKAYTVDHNLVAAPSTIQLTPTTSSATDNNAYCFGGGDRTASDFMIRMTTVPADGENLKCDAKL